MAQRLNILYQKKPCYDIVYSQSFDGLWEELGELGGAQKRLCIVTDSNVRGLYGEQLAKELEGKCRKVCLYEFPAGERSKTLDTVREVYKFLIEEGFDRKDMLLALGAVAAAYISWKRNMLSMEEYYEVRDMFVPFYLPISVEGISPEEIVALTKTDKKMEGGRIKFVLLKKIGKAVIDTSVTEEEILAAVNEIYYSEEDAHE